jgi:radical SAM protein with 4Fe4S-binding SPASM domain
MLDQALYQQVIRELAPTLSYLTFYFQGEPYLHPHFTEMVAFASEKNIYTSTSTNAHFLTWKAAETTVRSGLDRLIISIDGTTQEVYERYRVGGSLSKVMEGVRNVIEWKKRLRSHTPHVVFQFLVVGPNEHQIKEVFNIGRAVGVDEVALKTAQIYDFQNGSPLMPRNARYSRYEQTTTGSFRIKNPMENQCWKMWNSCVMTWDGNIVPCCFDKDATHVLGNVRSESFQNIWMGEPYRNFRASLLRSRAEIEICKNCTEGTKVWA